MEEPMIGKKLKHRSLSDRRGRRRVRVTGGICILFFLGVIPILQAQVNPDFFVDSKGNDTYPGTSKLQPKKTLGAISPLLWNAHLKKGFVKLALKSGDVFDENLLPPCPIQITTYADNAASNDFTILNGSKEYSTGWEKEPGLTNTWQQAIPYKGFVGFGINGVGSYSFIYVVEIDRALEKIAPFTARKPMIFLASQSAVEITAGSFHIPVNTTDNPKPVYIHPSDGGSPNQHLKFRYEVTVRDWAVNSTYPSNNRFENLWVRGFGAGNGMIPSGENSYYKRMIFGPGAGIHHLVVKSGTIDHSLFLPGAKNTGQFAVVFYDGNGGGKHCAIKNSMFFDIPEPVYAHTSSTGTNYGAVEIDHVLAFADNATGANGFMYTNNNDSVMMNSVYTDNYVTGYNYGNAKYATIRNSIFINTVYGLSFSAKNPVLANVSNVLIKTKGPGVSSGLIMQWNTDLTLQHSIVHLVNNNTASNNARVGAFVSGGGSEGSRLVATGNIFICDIDPAKSMTAATTNTNNGLATTKDRWNNNVYVLLRGKNMFWSVTNAATNGGSTTIQNFEIWKKQSGQDQNSLFFDLRNDSRGLKAIFADPANGNYDLANTAEGNRIAALQAGMTDPVTCFLQRPTYEAAAELVKNNQILSVNNCRNPCSQNKIRISASFDSTVINKRQVQLKWKVAEQQNIDHYELQRSMENPNFETIYTIAVTTDSLYSFTDAIQPGIEYRYRLRIKPAGAGECYSSIIPIKTLDDHPFTIYPNPSTGKILVSMNGYKGPAKLVVCNSLGQIKLVKESYSWYLPIELNCTILAKGMYSLQVETANGKTVQQFLML